MERRIRRLGLLALVLILMAASNPTESDFIRWVDSRVRQESKPKSFGEALLGGAVGALASISARLTVTRTNYVIFSIFTTRIGGRTSTYYGVFGQFVGS